jgi:hypothetical protein
MGFARPDGKTVTPARTGFPVLAGVKVFQAGLNSASPGFFPGLAGFAHTGLDFHDVFGKNPGFPFFQGFAMKARLLCCAMLLFSLATQAQTATPASGAAVVNGDAPLASVLVLPPDPPAAPGSIFLDEASRALGHQHWKEANDDFQKANDALVAAHQPFPPSRSFDWARTALLAGDLKTATRLDRAFGASLPGVSPQSLAGFRQDLAVAGSQGVNALHPDPSQVAMPGFPHAFLLIALFAAVGAGIALAVVILRYSASRYERETSTRRHNAFERKRLASRAAASLKP